MKKILSLALMLSLLIGGTCTTVSAAEVSTQAPTIIEKPLTEIQNNLVAPKAIGFHKEVKIVKTFTSKGTRIGYLSNVWAKASSYTVSKNKTISSSITIDGYTGGVSVTQGVSTTIPANSNRYSKLGAFSDVTFQKQKIIYSQGGMVYKTEYVLKPIKYANTRYTVIYK